MTFENLGLGPDTLRAVEDSGYTTPTPIQRKAIPYVLMGRDVLGCAQTGTGKTASFTLPMIDILAESRTRARMPRSLILAPTRELAAQVAESFERYAKYHKFELALLIGGTSLEDQEKKLDRGVQVLIATPGRLIDLFERGKVLLADAKILVIDEADRMLDMGFIPDVERIVKLLPRARQTLFFSATLAPEIRRLGDAFLTDPKEISVDPPASPAETVVQALVKLAGENREKRAALRQLIEQEEIASALVFCNRKKDVDILQRSFERHGYCSSALHGDMVQSIRMETLGRFKNGEIKVLVCSDVAARGLDIPVVSHVFNFDVPVNSEDYIHRIGRTGRAGRSGKAFMLASAAETRSLQGIERMLGRAIPETVLEGFGGWNDGDVVALDRRGRGRGKAAPRKPREANKFHGPRKNRETPSPAQEDPPQEDTVVNQPRKPSKPVAKVVQADLGTKDKVPAGTPGLASFGDHTPAFMRRGLG